MSASADLIETHDMIDNIERDLREELNCDAVIHMDPIVTDDEVTSKTREKVAELVKCIDKRITIHDFRMVTGPTHTNVIFDAAIPGDIKKGEQEILDDIDLIVKSIDPNYYTVVNLDSVYI